MRMKQIIRIDSAIPWLVGLLLRVPPAEFFPATKTNATMSMPLGPPLQPFSAARNMLSLALFAASISSVHAFSPQATASFSSRPRRASITAAPPRGAGGSICQTSVKADDAGRDEVAPKPSAVSDVGLANATNVGSSVKELVDELSNLEAEKRSTRERRAQIDTSIDEEEDYDDDEYDFTTPRRQRIRNDETNGRRRRITDDLFDDDFEGDDDFFDDDEDDYYDRRRKSNPRLSSKKKKSNRRRRLIDDDDDYEDDYYGDGDYESSGDKPKEKRRYGEYVTYFQEDFVEEDPNQGWEWETTRSGRASVLLPPLPDDAPANSAAPTPQSIIHFIGGAIVGSYPTQFYSDLLLPLAQQTNSVVVATNVPVTVDRNPLDHYALSDTIYEALEEAYEDVLCDEFDFDKLKDVPLVGVGHSLGSRLHVVMNTDDEDMVRRMEKRIPNKRVGNVFMGFNNYGASSAVPGVKTLRKGVKESEKYREQKRKGSRRRNGRRNRYSYDDEFEDDDYYDDDDSTIQEDLEEIFGLAMASVKSRLTPRELGENLEFEPTPDELWSSISSGLYGERIKNTLIVQFDRDRICQGSRLARALSEGTVEPSGGNIKFARLEGAHLTPSSSYKSNGLSLSKLVGLTQASLSFDAMAKEIARERKEDKKASKKVLEDKAHEMEALVQTLAMFVKEVR